LHFTLGQAIFLITFSSIISAFFEVLSWAWADRFWRKKLFLIWIFLVIIELLFWLFTKNFYFFILSEVTAWIWSAIMSGNLEALVHDKLEEEWKENEFKNITANSYTAIFIWRALATSVSGFLFILNPVLPVLLTLVSYIIIFLLTLNLDEPKQILSEHKDNFSHLKETLNFLKWQKVLVIFMLILWILSGLWNIYYFTQQPYYKWIWFDIEHVWLLFALWAIFSAIWSNIFKKISNKLDDKQILNIMLVMIFWSSILFSLFSKIWAILALIIISIMFWFIMTFWNNFIIWKTPKNQKSTILSVFSLMITIWYSFFNIILSLIIDELWIFNIYLVNIFLIILLIIFNLFTFNKS
jgi:predicted MFS family arabinose efflux permease